MFHPDLISPPTPLSPLVSPTSYPPLQPITLLTYSLPLPI